MIGISLLFGLYHFNMLGQTTMFKKVEFLKSGIILIDIMDGSKHEMTCGSVHEIHPTTKSNRQYHTIHGSFVGCINEYWLELEVKGSVRLYKLPTGRTLDGILLPIETRQQLTEHQITHLVVGHLVHGKFLCEKCTLKKSLSHPDAIAIYPINILPYSQDCHECGQMIFEVARGRDNQPLILFEQQKQ
jgi:hypothetical protein